MSSVYAASFTAKKLLSLQVTHGNIASISSPMVLELRLGSVSDFSWRRRKTPGFRPTSISVTVTILLKQQDTRLNFSLSLFLGRAWKDVGETKGRHEIPLKLRVLFLMINYSNCDLRWLILQSQNQVWKSSFDWGLRH